MIKPEIIRVDIDGFDSEIAVYNPGKSSILIGLHGFAGSALSFRKLVKHLPETITFYSISLPWHGGTSCSDPDKLLHLASYADALNKWIQSLEAEKVNLLAHSFGARICSVFAIRHPDSVQNMFYLAPGGFYPMEDFMFRFMVVPPFRFLSKYDFFIRPYAKFMIPNMKPEQEQAILYALKKIGWSFPAVSLRKHKLLKELIRYNGKLWLIMGKKDHLLPHSYGEKILSYFKNGKLTVFDTSGHLPMADNPKKTGEFIRDVLNSD